MYPEKLASGRKTIGSRKRSRSGDDSDCLDCLPISKRINSLCIRPGSQGEEPPDHLNNNISLAHNSCCQSGQSSGMLPSGASQLPWQQEQDQNPHNHSIEQLQCTSLSDPLLSSSFQPGTSYMPPGSTGAPGQVPSDVSVMDTEYSPELSESQNPHYYHINEVLFQAHTARITRQRSDSQLSFTDKPFNNG